MEEYVNKDTYNRSYVEVLEILKLIPKSEYDRIPKEKIEFFEQNKDKNYIYKYNLKDSKTLRKTDAIIINLYKDYIANEEEKKEIDEKLKQNLIKNEEEKREKYPVDIFKNKKEKIELEFRKTDLANNSVEPNKLIVYKESVIVRIWNKFKKIIKGEI